LISPGILAPVLCSKWQSLQGQIQDFKLGGGGAHLKKLRRAGGGAKILGVFRVKNHDFMPRNHIFFQFWGGARRVRPTIGSAPALLNMEIYLNCKIKLQSMKDYDTGKYIICIKTELNCYSTETICY
jgi:hypothetical protein